MLEWGNVSGNLQMGALPVLDIVVESGSALPPALAFFADPQGVLVEPYRVFLSARISHGATLLIVTDEASRNSELLPGRL